MLTAEDLEIIIKELERSENDRVDNIIKRLNILIAQDKLSTEMSKMSQDFRDKMEEYSKQLQELTKPIEK